MDFKELQNLIADWYDVAPEVLGLSDDQIPAWLNPMLTDFTAVLAHWRKARPGSGIRLQRARLFHVRITLFLWAN